MKRVLLVDDDPEFVGLIRVRLEAAGCRVETASDGAQALERIRKSRPDIVFLDIQMPSPDGLEVLKQIRKQDKNLPVYMLTALSDARRFESANKLQASGFIPKTNDLFREIQNVTAALHLSGRYHAGKRAGFALMELIIAILLLVGGVSACTYIFGRGIYATADTENLEQGIALAQEKMESIRGTAFASVANEAKAAVSGWSGFSRQVAVSQPAGTNSDFKQVVVTSYWDTNEGEVSTALTSYVANVVNN